MKKVIIVTVYVDAGSTRSRGLNTPINFPATVPLLKIIPTPFRAMSRNIFIACSIELESYSIRTFLAYLD